MGSVCAGNCLAGSFFGRACHELVLSSVNTQQVYQIGRNQTTGHRSCGHGRDRVRVKGGPGEVPAAIASLNNSGGGLVFGFTASVVIGLALFATYLGLGHLFAWLSRLLKIRMHRPKLTAFFDFGQTRVSISAGWASYIKNGGTASSRSNSHRNWSCCRFSFFLFPPSHRGPAPLSSQTSECIRYLVDARPDSDLYN